MGKSWTKLLNSHSWEIAVGAAILFFLFLSLFYKPISKWLQGKEDFAVGRHVWDRKSIPIARKNETRCREIFESLYQRPFPSVRPAFLKRANGYALELDGYNKDLKLAFEYQGVQHYKFSPRFHRSEKDFTDQVERDRDKRLLCQKAGVTVLEIPYSIRYEKLESYIREQLRNRGLM